MMFVTRSPVYTCSVGVPTTLTTFMFTGNSKFNFYLNNQEGLLSRGAYEMPELIFFN